jgi:uncharacterized protein YndB with AHSA1/START domain
MSRKIELAVEVPGTPEEVWAAIATGPGISSWFIPMQVEEREGGEVAMDFGDFGTERARVTAWEPPHRVVFEGGEERSLAYEWLVEARGGGTCIVRLVNTGFGDGGDWDGDYDGMGEGWRIFLQSLRLHLTHFRGRRAQAFVPTAMMPGPGGDAWKRLCADLGIPDDAVAGDRIQTGADTPRLAGTVESTIASEMARAYLLLLDDDAGSGFLAVEGAGEQVAASLYLYLYDEAAAADGPAWRTWLTERFAPVTAPPSD